MKIELSSAERKRLKASAHALDPVVLIGGEGLKPAVLREIDRSLNAHELIKIRAFSDEREERAAWLEAICAQLSAAPVQHIGKILVVFRANPDKKPPSAAKPRRKQPRLTKRQEVNKVLTRRRPRS
jgi:RNA-binding protein